MDTRCSKQAFIRLDDEGSVTRLCKELETVLESRMHDASEVRLGMEDCIRDLRQLGHDLWAFDGSNEFESECRVVVHIVSLLGRGNRHLTSRLSPYPL
jgi:hypothetical protein